MWCAYAFAALACVGLPSAISSHSPVVPVSWISQTFLQLVLLSVIIVGQNVLAAAADKRSEATFQDGDAVLHESVKLQEHLLAQDEVLTGQVDNLARVEARIACAWLRGAGAGAGPPGSPSGWGATGGSPTRDSTTAPATSSTSTSCTRCAPGAWSTIWRGGRRGSPERGCVASAVEGPPTVRFRIIAESPPDGAALYPVRPGVTGCPVRCRVRGRPRSWRWSGVGGSDPSPRCGRRRRRREGPCARGGHVSCRRQGAT